MSRATHNGEDVTVLRRATSNDSGFDPQGGVQMVVRRGDGAERVVKQADLEMKDEE